MTKARPKASRSQADKQSERSSTEVASLEPQDAGKGPIKVTLAGEPGSNPDKRSSAAATRTG
ncbi:MULTISPECIES: hypothetical protein [unclassified Brevundimonas]|uniref:hypothetical protein n=1 Tax=unclassified Brevundimonas TaxID=2622653 RepID=UPI0025C6E081|nr:MULTISPECIES: hypothetical protein [unclassified Brevundimonas]